MLLRLLPTPSPSQPSPPTILFTLPLPTHPYTSRSLPLPPNLLAHRSVCLQEDIECSNVLLGEKSSWISGAVDDVTFSLPAELVSVHMIDGSTLHLPIDERCKVQLRRVIEEVRLSFAPPPPPPTPIAESRASISSVASSTASIASTSSTKLAINVAAVPRRSPGNLLFSLLSPLLPNPQGRPNSPSPAQAEISPSRMHRRQARSILVDTYRRHVLPLLKDQLPSAYLPWIISSETAKKMDEFEQLRGEINAVLAVCNVDEKHFTTVLKRSRSNSSSCSSAESDSESEDRSPNTPATSIFSNKSTCSTPQSNRSRSLPTSPQSFLLAIPPAHALPAEKRPMYSAQLARLTHIASRLSVIKRLCSKYEREEGKRKWLESLERGKAGERALRRAYSNGQLKGSDRLSSTPNKHSRLWESVTAEDIDRVAQMESREPVHPAMMDSDNESISDAGSVSDEELFTPSTPTLIERPLLVIPEAANEAMAQTVIHVHHQPVVDDDVYADMPPLITSPSDESLTETEEEWDADGEADIIPSPLLSSAALLPPPSMKVKGKPFDWSVPDVDPDADDMDDEPIAFPPARRLSALELEVSYA